jgi:hypothetical protein
MPSMLAESLWYVSVSARKPAGTLVEVFDRDICFFETAPDGVLDSRR